MSQSSPGAQAWVHLDIARALEQIGDEQALRGMLPMLQDLLERDLPQITQLLASQDVRGANPLLHSLKGCLPIFCAPPVCEQLAQVEHMSKIGGSVEVSAAFAELSPKLQLLKEEVILYLAQPV
jgi:HPt (histidine-containing phosphotransfer) domain-containing protein